MKKKQLSYKLISKLLIILTNPFYFIWKC